VADLGRSAITNMKTQPIKTLAIIIGPILFAACSHVTQESGRKTELNGDTGCFEDNNYASVGLSTEKQNKPAKPLSEKELSKAKDK